jgi:hypothetical protein
VTADDFPKLLTRMTSYREGMTDGQLENNRAMQLKIVLSVLFHCRMANACLGHL